MCTYEELMMIRNNEYMFGKLLESNEIVPFVGAGMSCNIYPLWDELLRSFPLVSDEKVNLESLLDDGRFEEAASYLMNIDSKSLVDTIKSTLNPSKINYNDISAATKLLPDITKNLIVTTNLDCILEHIWEQKNDYIRTTTPDANDLFNDAIINKKKCLIKLHGSVEESSKYILTKEQYDTAYGINSDYKVDFSSSFVKNLGRMFMSKTFLFLGCSLKSDRTLHVLKSIMVHFNSNIQHYAFVQLNENDDENTLLERKLNQYGISIIWFPKGEFHSIKTLLEKLKQSIGNNNSINTLPKIDLNFVGRDNEIESIKKN